MTLHLPAWLVYTAFYTVSGSLVLLLLFVAVTTFHQRTVELLRSANYYAFALVLMWNKYKRAKEERNIWEIIDLHAASLREENPERFREINSRLNFGTILDKSQRITKAVQDYLADPEHQKRSDMESVICQVLEEA